MIWALATPQQLGLSGVGALRARVWFEGDIVELIANRITMIYLTKLTFDLAACVRYQLLYFQKVTA